MAFAGRLQQRRPQAEGTVLQRVQIDAADDDIAAEQGRGHFGAAEIGGDGCQVFRGDQRDLACPAVSVIAGQAGNGIETGLGDR